MNGRIVGHGSKARYYLDGLEVTRSAFYALMPEPASGPLFEDRSGKCGIQPSLSDALAVHPDQVQEAVEDAKKHGVPTDFQKDGRPIITSRAHQKAYLKAYKYHNRDGGYGD